MNRRVVCACALVLLAFAAAPVLAQTADTAATVPAETTLAVRPTLDPEAPVMQYYLDGPRIGVTFMSNGEPRTQFGWHAENQASPGTRGPWFLVERIFLVGGVERGEFIPSGTVVFGVRTPDSFEFGIGPSVTIGAGGFSTAVVIAAGRTLRYGGIRVPVNLALALSERRQVRHTPTGRMVDRVTSARLTLITGWAIKQTERERERARRPYRFGLEK